MAVAAAAGASEADRGGAEALPFIGRQNTLATKILLATSTRISELAGARWEHVNVERTEWMVPHSKGDHRAFIIPLCHAVVGWFRELKTYAFGGTFMLPARQARRTAAWAVTRR